MFQNKFLCSKANLAFSLFFLFIISSTNLFADTELLKVNWKFQGITGKFDRASLQRGYQVYNEVCSSCHSMRLLSYRNLGEKGGPEFSADQVKAIATTFEVIDGPDNQGEMFTRPGKPSDKFVLPYPNVQASMAANGEHILQICQYWSKQEKVEQTTYILFLWVTMNLLRILN